MSKDFDEEFDLVKELRDAQALEVESVKEDGTFSTKVVQCALSKSAADTIEKQRQEIEQLRQMVVSLKNKN